MTTEERSTVRRLTPVEIGRFVKAFRNHLGLKQINLAQDANLTERTIQRVETGHPVSDETLKQIATALKLDPDILVKPQEIPTDAEIARRVRDWEEQHFVLDVIRADTGRAILDLIVPCGYFHFDNPEAKDAEQKGTFGAFFDSITDWNCVVEDLQPSARLDAAQAFTDLLTELEAQGCWVFVGRRDVRARFKGADTKPFNLNTGYVFIRPKGSTFDKAVVPRRPTLSR